MGVAMKQFIDRFKAMEKIANETLAANPEALVGVDSLPGAEHDAKVPEEAKKPDPEVTQGQPAGATSASGAVNGGDAKPLNEGKLEMDQPLLNPEEKPLITGDALTAKTANEHLVSLVSDLLKDINEKKASAKPEEVKKEAQCGGGSGATHTATPAKKEEKKEEGKEEPKGGEKKAGENRVVLNMDEDMLNKIAAAQAVFMAGREAAEKAVKQAEVQKQASDPAAGARALIKDACVKAAQEAGLDPAAAQAAAENAMAAAGVPPEAAAAADAGAAAADAGAAEAAAGDAAAAADAGDAALPDDVTEEELATAIVDLVSSGELDPDTAKALVEEIAGDQGGAAPTEDQAAEIIADGLQSGEITPEQAQEIAAAVEGGAANDATAAADAGAAAAEAQGAADAEAAAQDAADEAKGAADAEAAMKEAAAMIRHNTLSKVANHIVAKRNEKVAAANPPPGARVMSKVASILEAKKAELAKNEKTANDHEARYIAGFAKKAAEMGVDPSALARYVCERQKAQAQAK